MGRIKRLCRGHEMICRRGWSSLVGGLPAGLPGDGAEDAGKLGICGDLGGPELEHVLLLGGEIG